jgi:hypothetical protein
MPARTILGLTVGRGADDRPSGSRHNLGRYGLGGSCSPFFGGEPDPGTVAGRSVPAPTRPPPQGTPLIFNWGDYTIKTCDFKRPSGAFVRANRRRQVDCRSKRLRRAAGVDSVAGQRDRLRRGSRVDEFSERCFDLRVELVEFADQLVVPRVEPLQKFARCGHQSFVGNVAEAEGEGRNSIGKRSGRPIRPYRR